MSRVRVILEGEITRRGPQWFALDDSSTIFHTAAHVVSVEDIPDPEPEWRTGDVATCHHGHTYMRAAKGVWWSPRADATDENWCTGFTLAFRKGSVS